MGRKALPTEVKRLKGTLRLCRTNPLAEACERYRTSAGVVARQSIVHINEPPPLNCNSFLIIFKTKFHR